MSDLRPIAYILLWCAVSVLLFALIGCAHNDGMGDLYKGVGRVLQPQN